MAYKIAVASSDGKNVDLHLGSSPFLKVYTAEGLSFQFLEDRKVDVSSEADVREVAVPEAMVVGVRSEAIRNR